jgi:hypothetical protein
MAIEDPEEIKRNYFVPHFGYDSDVNGAKESLAAAEKELGHTLKIKVDGEGSYSLLQTDADVNMGSDPICASSGCTQYKQKVKERGYKIDYFVPHFGEDNDMTDGKNNLKLVEN